MKKKSLLPMLFLCTFILGGCGETKEINIEDSSEYKKLESEKEDLSKDYSELSDKYDDLLKKYNDLEESTTTEAKNEDVPQDLATDCDASEATSQEVNSHDNYRSDITFANLMRKPDDYQSELVKFQGTVVEFIELENENNIRLAINDSYDEIIYVGYDKDLLDFRLMENDTVTIYGTSYGLYTYNTILGDEVTLPSVWADEIVLQE